MKFSHTLLLSSILAVAAAGEFQCCSLIGNIANWKGYDWMKDSCYACRNYFGGGDCYSLDGYVEGERDELLTMCAGVSWSMGEGDMGADGEWTTAAAGLHFQCKRHYTPTSPTSGTCVNW